MLYDYRLNYAHKLKKALEHLRYGEKKVRRLSVDAARLDEEELAAWESFSARFARVASRKNGRH